MTNLELLKNLYNQLSIYKCPLCNKTIHYQQDHSEYCNLREIIYGDIKND